MPPTSPLAFWTRLSAPALIPPSRRGIFRASTHLSRNFHSASKMASSNKIIATLDTSLIPRLPDSSPTLFEAKKRKNLTFEEIGKSIGRDEVAVAALFYGQAMASPEDAKNLSELLEIPLETLEAQLSGFPDRGKILDMPPKDPLIYRLYEIVQNYGMAYKAVINEKFGDGIMSAISYSTKVEKEEDEKGVFVKLTLRGKWLPYSRF